MVEEPDHSGVALRVLDQEVLVADGGQEGLLSLRRQVREIVRLRVGVEPDQVVPHRLRHRRVGEELGERPASRAGDQLVRPPGLAVEEHRPLEAQVSVGVRNCGDALVVALPVDPDLLEQAFRDLAVLRGRLDVQGAAVHQVGPAVEPELVAFRVAAEVIVVVEDQDAGIRSRLFREVVRGGEPRDPGPHHHQVVRLADVGGGPLAALVGELVRDLERPLVGAAHPGAERRVVRLARPVDLRLELRDLAAGEGRPGEGDRNTGEEIAATDAVSERAVRLRRRGHGRASGWRAAPRPPQDRIGWLPSAGGRDEPRLYHICPCRDALPPGFPARFRWCR